MAVTLPGEPHRAHTLLSGHSWDQHLWNAAAMHKFRSHRVKSGRCDIEVLEEVEVVEEGDGRDEDEEEV